MAVNIATIDATKKQSIARVELFTDANRAQDDWTLRIHFEDALYDGDGNLIPGSQSFGSRVVERRFGDVKTQSVTAAGVTATVAQIAALIAAGAYIFRVEDVGS